MSFRLRGAVAAPQTPDSIHSDKSRKLTLYRSFAEGLSSPVPAPAPPPASRPRSLHRPVGVFTLWPAHLHALRYLHCDARVEHWRVGLYVCNSSFPAGRSGPPRVAHAERQLELRGSDEGMSRNWGFLTMDGSV